MANRLRSLGGSGMASNTSDAGCCVFQRASIAANLAGWYLWIYPPIKLPTSICIGTSTATNPRPQWSITRLSAGWTPRKVYQAPVATTHMPLVRKAASSICGQRTRTIGPVVIAHQSAGTILPLTMVCPRGTCIQLLLQRIQKDENIVPRETMQQAKK